MERVLHVSSCTKRIGFGELRNEARGCCSRPHGGGLVAALARDWSRLKRRRKDAKHLDGAEPFGRETKLVDVGKRLRSWLDPLVLCGSIPATTTRKIEQMHLCGET